MPQSFGRSLAWQFTALLLAATGCGGDKALPPGASVDDEPMPAVGDLELPVSLRTKDAAPTDARQVQVGVDGLWLEGERVLTLANGRVGANDRQGGVLPALATRLQNPPRATVALRMVATVPYETLALILSTARSVGMGNAAIQVRRPGDTQQTGWLELAGFVMSSKADDLPPITAVPARSWNAFTEQWKAVFEGCRAAESGDCAWVNENVALGGTLKIELLASGRGVNVHFFRRGLTPAQEAKEDKKRARILAAKKEDFLQGRLSRDDLVEALLLGDPSTYALFQFRSKEALKGPSPLAATIGPVCHHERCGVVVSADTISPLVNVVSMLGAAFPDGTPGPALAIEMPWTERPKPAVLSEWIARQSAK